MHRTGHHANRRLTAPVEHVGNDTGHDQQGNAVADAVFGDTLTDPHRQGAARCHRQTDDKVPNSAIGIGTHGKDEANRLNERQNDGQVAGVLVDLLAALRAFIRQLLQCRNGNRQKLKDDAGVDVRSDTHGHDAHVLERTAGHHVHEVKDRVVLHRAGHRRDVDARNRDHAQQAVDQQHAEGVNDLLAELRNAPGILHLFQHIRSPQQFHRRPRFSPSQNQ